MSGDSARLRPKPTETQRLAAEFVGTFFLTLVAAGADSIDWRSGGEIGHTARYLAPGLLVTALIWSFSAVSGAHINPAVTLAFVVRRSFPVVRAIGYWVVQCAAGIAAALVLRAFFDGVIAHGVTTPGAGVTTVAACAWEALLTFLLVLVILGTSEEEAVVGKNAALAVGLTIAACGLFSSPITGASMNPARSLGPALVAGRTGDLSIYVLGPVVGALAAAVVATIIHGRADESERQAAHGKHQ
jgi:aquaporin Z